MPTFYETLDVPTDATTDQIKKQYKKLALKWHPDKNGNSEDSQERFKKIAQAYSVLSDDSQRRQYDAELRDASRRGFGGGGGGFGGGGFDVGGGSGGSRTSPPKPCPHCGGTCAPGTCPFAGSNPFDTRFNPNFNRSNRSSSDGRATRPMMGESPFGAFPSFEDDFFARHRARAARSSRHTSGGGGVGGGGGFGKGADFGFLDAEAIFREFFGGRDPFETMLGGGSMLGGGGGRMSDGFGGGAFGSFGAMGAFDDFGASSARHGATVHVTRTVRDPDGSVHTTTYTTVGGGGGGGDGLARRGATGRAALPPSESRRPASQYTSFSSAQSGRSSTRTSGAVSGATVSGGAVSGESRTSGGGRPTERGVGGVRGGVRQGRGGGGGGLDEDEQLAADLAEAIRISRDLSLDDEERMMQAAIRASLGR